MFFILLSCDPVGEGERTNKQYSFLNKNEIRNKKKIHGFFSSLDRRGWHACLFDYFYRRLFTIALNTVVALDVALIFVRIIVWSSVCYRLLDKINRGHRNVSGLGWEWGINTNNSSYYSVFGINTSYKNNIYLFSSANLWGLYT